jgi:protein-tyrosine phosphatase
MTTATRSRLLPLEGGYNLRDMGGYATGDGRTVRDGMLYRSGMMSMLTEADEAHLAALGIATVCDLRRPGERRREPTRWCEPAGVHYWSRDYVETSGALAELINGDGISGGQMRDVMIALYRELPVDHAPSYAYMFERLAAGNVPLLFNCSAGKDRTGVAAALILTALGVCRDHIFEDYLATNEHADHRRLIARFGSEGERFRRVPPEVIAPLMAADPAYLDSMFDSLERDHGGIDSYFAGIGVDAAAKARLRELLLT